MKIQEFYETARKFIEAVQDVDEARARQLDFEKNNKPPIKPTQVESWDEWNKYLDAEQAFKAEIDRYDTEVTEAKSKRSELETILKKVMPIMVWFRVDNQGIGVSYTNWGGSHYDLITRPWQEQMPSLDHTYHGD